MNSFQKSYFKRWLKCKNLRRLGIRQASEASLNCWCVWNLFDPLSTGRLGFLSRKVCTERTDLQLQPARGIPGSWNKRCVQNGFWSRSISPRKQERSEMLPVYFRRMVGQCFFSGLINATWSVDINHLRASPYNSWILMLWKPFISSRHIFGACYNSASSFKLG